MLGLDDVVDLEVAEQQAQLVQVAERGEDLEHVGDGLGGRERIRLAAAGLPPGGQDLLEAPAADVLHDDVAGALVLDEVEDLHDVRVLDLGQEAALGQRGGHRVVVARVQQSLEHHPAVGHVAVAGQVDPAHPAVREAPHDLVLAGDQLAGAELGLERERRAALAAEARGRVPGASSRPRPTGSSQRAQKRRLSGTTAAASSSTASDGSRNGTAGISTRPAPRRAARARAAVRPVVARRLAPSGRRGQRRSMGSAGAGCAGAIPHTSQ